MKRDPRRMKDHMEAEVKMVRKVVTNGAHAYVLGYTLQPVAKLGIQLGDQSRSAPRWCPIEFEGDFSPDHHEVENPVADTRLKAFGFRLLMWRLPSTFEKLSCSSEAAWMYGRWTPQLD